MSEQGFAGWTGEPPDAPALPVTELLLARRERAAGPLETALARSAADDAREAREAAANAPDLDERASAFVTRGYTPGLISQLCQRLGDTETELAAEEDRLERAAKRQERITRDHLAGRITVVDIARFQAEMDEGDQGAVERLRRQRDGLKRQIAEASQVITPPARREPDPAQAAVSRARAAHREYVEASRAAWEAAQSGTARRARRPFVSRAYGDGHFDVPHCEDCVKAGATAEESFLIHADPSPGPVPDDWQPAVPYCRGCGALQDHCVCSTVPGGPAERYQPVHTARGTFSYDKRRGEIEAVR